jgi:hypothetical protein
MFMSSFSSPWEEAPNHIEHQWMIIDDRDWKTQIKERYTCHVLLCEHKLLN